MRGHTNSETHVFQALEISIFGERRKDEHKLSRCHTPEEEISYILAPQTHVHAVMNMITRPPSAFLEHAGLFTKRPTHRKTGMSGSRTDIYGLSTRSGTPRTGCQIRTCTTKLDARSPIALRVDVLKFLNEKPDIQPDILGFQCSSARGGGGVE